MRLIRFLSLLLVISVFLLLPAVTSKMQSNKKREWAVVGNGNGSARSRLDACKLSKDRAFDSAKMQCATASGRLAKSKTSACECEEEENSVTGKTWRCAATTEGICMGS